MKTGTRHEATGNSEFVPSMIAVLLLALSALLFAFCLSAEAQQAAKIPRVGILFIGGRERDQSAIRCGCFEIAKPTVARKPARQRRRGPRRLRMEEPSLPGPLLQAKTLFWITAMRRAMWIAFLRLRLNWFS